jgi:isopentenyl-diphosphate delta-isomerase
MLRTNARRTLPEPPDELVEVVDAADRPLAVMPLRDVHRQSLRHRSVLVLVYDADHRIFLQKRNRNKSLYPGRWDLSATGHVQAGESRSEAAARELREELGIIADRLRLIRRIPAGQETGFEFVSLYSAGRIAQEPRPNADEVEDGMFTDKAELAYLVENYRDMLTPGLVYFWERGLVFPSIRGG